MTPTFKEERRLWKRGFCRVAGADEVGRGAWAGPIVAGAVVFDPQRVLPRVLPPASAPRLRRSARVSGSLPPVSPALPTIDDSKRMSPREREKAAEWIKENCLGWGIGEVPPSVINRFGMAKATKMAFRSAIAALKVNLGRGIALPRLDFLLVDAFYVPYTRGLRRKNQKAIVRGDQKSISIAAASIIAKVHRDGLMRKLSRRHKVYGWGRNKGYGTREHQGAIKKHGLTRLHRKGFVPEALLIAQQGNKVTSYVKSCVSSPTLAGRLSRTFFLSGARYQSCGAHARGVPKEAPIG